MNDSGSEVIGVMELPTTASKSNLLSIACILGGSNLLTMQRVLPPKPDKRPTLAGPFTQPQPTDTGIKEIHGMYVDIHKSGDLYFVTDTGNDDWLSSKDIPEMAKSLPELHRMIRTAIKRRQSTSIQLG